MTFRRGTRRSSLIATMIASGLVGCDRSPAPPPPAPPAGAAPTQADAPPPPKERVPAVFFVGEQSITFPPAKLVVRPGEPQLQIAIFSDDPPEAVRDSYRGNSFYFDVAIDAENADELAGKTFTYRNDVTERTESTIGLFLAGGKQILQPLTATVSFETEAGDLFVNIAGNFQLFEDVSPESSPRTILVRAKLMPEVVVKKK